VKPASLSELRRTTNFGALGEQMHGLLRELHPWCRSITGAGLRRTLQAVSKVAPLQVHEVPSGTPVLDWTVPREWAIRDAWVANARGERVIDFQKSNLHVVSYSTPVRTRMPLSQLRAHLHTLPEQPDWIPYRTAYYAEDWGFCLPHRVLERLPEGEYEVVIDSSLEAGSLSYGELLLRGESPKEVLFSTHVCHPSLANDNLSGVVLAAFLAKALASVPRRLSYRFVFVPGTIGSITWLSRNRDAAERVHAGLVVAGVGDSGPLSYKKSRAGDAEIDRAAVHALRFSGQPHGITEFSPYGYDERQYCSPGFNLPVGSLTRTPHGKYPEYHTSADDCAFVRPESLAGSLRAYLDVVAILEGNGRYRNTQPEGEPQLGRRGLYRFMGGLADPGAAAMAMLWILNLSDGGPSLLEIAERAGIGFDAIREAADALTTHGLLANTVEGLDSNLLRLTSSQGGARR
jgi:aminopeptidase-like protein